MNKEAMMIWLTNSSEVFYRIDNSEEAKLIAGTLLVLAGAIQANRVEALARNLENFTNVEIGRITN